MGILYEDFVVISQAEKPDESTVITVNCPDKTGLGCDLCRIILLFGLSIRRGGMLLFRFLFFQIFFLLYLMATVTGTVPLCFCCCGFLFLFDYLEGGILDFGGNQVMDWSLFLVYSFHFCWILNVCIWGLDSFRNAEDVSFSAVICSKHEVSFFEVIVWMVDPKKQ